MRFRHTWRHSHAVKRVADVLMLFTLIPLLWPYPDGSAGGIHFFRSRYFLYSVLALYSVAELSYGWLYMLGLPLKNIEKKLVNVSTPRAPICNSTAITSQPRGV